MCQNNNVGQHLLIGLLLPKQIASYSTLYRMLPCFPTNMRHGISVCMRLSLFNVLLVKYTTPYKLYVLECSFLHSAFVDITVIATDICPIFVCGTVIAGRARLFSGAGTLIADIFAVVSWTDMDCTFGHLTGHSMKET